MEKKKQEIILGLIFFGIIVFFGLNSEIYSARIDITENKVFTITPVSRNLFRDIKEQMHITYYLTEKLKSTNAVYRQIEDILREYAAYSNGKIKLDVVDPVRDNRLQEVQEYQINQFEESFQEVQGEANVFVAYSGIVIQYLNRIHPIPEVKSTDTLEYNLTSSIRQLITNKTNKIGYLIDRDDLNRNEFQQILNLLHQFFEIEELQKGADIPGSIDTLVIIGGTGLTPFDLYPIDQYIMRGGRVFFASDRILVNFQYMMALPPSEGPVFTMLKNYGVAIEPQLIMEDPRLSLVAGRTPYNYCFNTIQDYVSKDNPITSHFSNVNFLWASPLTLAAPAGVKTETLINTSPFAVTVQDQIPIDPREASVAYSTSKSEKASLPIAAALAGNFTSYFKDKPIPAKEGEKRDWTKTENLSGSTRIIVVGDADFLFPRYMTQNNFAFFINSINWLSNDEDLLSIRTRAQRDLLMAKIQDPGQRTNAINFIIIFNLIGVPLIVIIFGIVNFLVRRNKKKA